MAFISLSYATQVDGFMDKCGNLWIVVLVATVGRGAVASCIFGALMNMSFSIESADAGEICTSCSVLTVLAAPFATLCWFEGVYIHDGLTNADCKALMQSTSFKTPMLAEIGAVGMVFDSVVAVAVMIPFLFSFFRCFGSAFFLFICGACMMIDDREGDGWCIICCHPCFFFKHGWRCDISLGKCCELFWCWPIYLVHKHCCGGR